MQQNLSFMSNKKQNEELQSRREFFKKAAKAALPVVGAVVMASMPNVMQAAETGCGLSCSNSCMGSCENTCHSMCQGSCKFGCQNSCSGSCETKCTTSCGSQAYF